MANENNSLNAFISEKQGSAYFGAKGLTLTNKIIMNSNGEVFFKEGVLGGALNSEVDKPEFKESWLEGWRFQTNKIWSLHTNPTTGEQDYCTLQNKYVHGMSSYLVLGSSDTVDHKTAKFRFSTDGYLRISEINTGTYDKVHTVTSTNYSATDGKVYSGYGAGGIKIISWNTDKSAAKYQLNLYPNSIYFWNNQNENSDYHTAARITYIPGRSYNDEASTYVGNFLRITCPIEIPSIYLGSDNIRYITTGAYKNSSLPEGEYEERLFLGPTYLDIQDSWGKRRTKARPWRTILRGKDVTIAAYGTYGDEDSNATKTGVCDGTIYTNSNGIILQNNSCLYGLLKGYRTTNLSYVQTIARVDTDGTVGIGSSGNKYSLVLKTTTGKGIYFITNGKTTSALGTSYVFYLGPASFTIDGSSVKRPVFRPQDKGYARLGTSTRKWYRLYANITSIGSDKRLKNNIEDINSQHLQFFDLLKPVSFTYNDKEVTDKNEQKKKHFGFIAQDVETALEQVGLNSDEFGALEKPHIEDGEEAYYSLDYTKFIALNTAKIKQLESIIQQQQEQINLLISKLDS